MALEGLQKGVIVICVCVCVFLYRLCNWFPRGF